MKYGLFYWTGGIRMLIDFTLENFRSYKNETTLSLIASSDKTHLESIASDVFDTGFDVLRSVSVFGANASGKSNLLFGLSCMRQQVLQPVGQPMVDGFSPFVLDSSMLEKPLVMEVTFIQDSVPYRYGFSASYSHNEILEEWLYYFPKGRRKILFERKAKCRDSKVESTAIKFGDDWRGEAKSLEHRTRPDALFISLASSLNHEIASTVVDWFRRSIVSLGGSHLQDTLEKIHSDERIKRAVTELVRKADLNIETIETFQRPFQRPFLESFEPKMREAIEEQMKRMKVVDASIVHKGVDAEGQKTYVQIPLSEESAGTRKMIGILGPVVSVLANGGTLLIDEFDLRLHPVLARTVIELFHHKKTNPGNGQLIVTSHDASLLDQNSLFRRDQVVLVEKDDAGSSSIISLWDIKVRNRENIFKNYMAGRYGGVPFAEVMLEQDIAKLVSGE